MIILSNGFRISLARATVVLLARRLSDGVVWDLIAGATEMYHGHAAISAAGYRSDRRIQKTMRQDRPPIDALRCQPHGNREGILLKSISRGEHLANPDVPRR